jgi:Zn-dependent peptidase ImmA (M78 family)
MNGLAFTVGANTYHVEEVEGLVAKYEVYGQVTHTDNLVEIDSDMAKDRKANVLIHELLHAMLFEAGYDEQDEDQVRRLGNVLSQVLRDNDFGFMRQTIDWEAVE